MSIRHKLNTTKIGSQVKGHALMAKIRYASDTRHMIICDTTQNKVANVRVRIFLSDEGYDRAIQSEKHGNIDIVRHYRVRNGNLIYQPHKTKHQQLELNI